MARILIGSMPFVSHINPVIPVARKLVERGHEVRWYTGHLFKDKVESTGAQYLPMKAGFDFDETKSDQIFPEMANLNPFQKFKYATKHIFIDAVPGQVEDIREILRDYPADVTLCEVGFGGFGFIYEQGGPPWATFNVLPLGLSSRDTAPFGLGILPSSSPLGRLRNRALDWTFSNFMFRDVLDYMNKVRADAGLGPAASPLDSQLSPFLYMQSTTEAFEYPRSDLPPQVHFVGPILPEAPRDFTQPAWWSDLEGNRPVVLVTQGTVANHDLNELIGPTIKALADHDILVVVTTGGKPVASLGLDRIPDNVRVEGFIPYAQLMPHVDVMLTNAGYGGVQVALSNGVPVIAAGRTEDKPEVSSRVQWAGV